MTKILFMVLAMLSSHAMADDSFIINKDGKEYICRAESTMDPGTAADCALKAYQGPFSRDEAVTLCRRNGSIANADCAIKAYQGPYSKEEAIRLCKNDPHSVIKVLNMLEASNKTLFMNNK